MSPYEAETIVRFNEESQTAELYTASKRVADLLARRGITPHKTDTLKGKESGWYYRLPKSAVLLKPASRMIRVGGSRKINSMLSGDALGATSGEVSD